MNVMVCVKKQKEVSGGTQSEVAHILTDKNVPPFLTSIYNMTTLQ